MAKGAGLENRSSRKRAGGSNPSLSASLEAYSNGKEEGLLNPYVPGMGCVGSNPTASSNLESRQISVCCIRLEIVAGFKHR